MTPLIEIFTPCRLANGQWFVRANVNLWGGVVTITATAPEAIAAMALARFQVMMATRLNQRAQMLLNQGIVPTMNYGNSMVPQYSAVGREEVAGFWGSLKKGFGKVLKNPIFKGVVGTALKCVPVVGPALGDIGGKALDMAGGALEGAKKGKRSAKRAIRKVTKAAKAGDPRAQKANRLMVAAAKVGQTPKGRRTLKGVLQAGKLVKQAGQGNVKARAMITNIANQAKFGNRAGLQAFGFIAAAQRALEPEMPPIAEEEYGEPEDEFGDGMEGGDGVFDSDEQDIEDEAVGALMKGMRRVTRAQVQKELVRLRKARRGYRRSA